MTYLRFGNDDSLSKVGGLVGSLGTRFDQVIKWQASACNATLTTVEQKTQQVVYVFCSKTL